MSTQRYWYCSKCGKKAKVPFLFDALFRFVGVRPTCDHCSATKELHLDFDFGLGATGAKCTVRDVFRPPDPPSWKHEGETVTYYPFLVVLEDEEREQCFWLPYWHVHGTRRKFGQWAPFMNARLFRSLLDQAREKGYC